MHVLLTRPQGDSQNTAQILQQFGHTVSIVPLLEIQPVDEGIRRQRIQTILSGGKPDGIICISKNAVLWGLPLLLESWPLAAEKARWFAVGSGTADALVTLGMNAEFPTAAQAENFLDMSDLQQVRGQRFLYIAGENGRPLIEAELARRGAELQRWDVYRRRLEQAATGQLAQLEEIPDILTAMSGDSLVALEQALPDTKREKWLVKKLLVPSERVFEMAKQIGFANIQIVPVMEKDWPLGYLRQEASL